MILFWLFCKLCCNESLSWLQLGVINMKCELVDPDGLLKQLRVLKSVNVDGVMVDCWWGIVEAHAPQDYNWSGYKKLSQMVSELKLKLQVWFVRYAFMLVVACLKFMVENDNSMIYSFLFLLHLTYLCNFCVDTVAWWTYKVNTFKMSN